jgi:hypothetical protein
VKSMSIHVISGQWLDPLVIASGNLSQLGTDKHIGSGLEFQAGYIIILIERTSNNKIGGNWTVPWFWTKKWNQGSLVPHHLKEGYHIPLGLDPWMGPILMNEFPIMTNMGVGYTVVGNYWKKSIEDLRNIWVHLFKVGQQI